jgi:SP family facilitated glucose transporter-like MFS transporter 8
MGAILGYSSPAGSQLKGPDLPPNATLNVSNIECTFINDEPLTDNQISWFGSTVNIGALIGAPLGGVCINLIGRRTTMVASIAPFLLGWLLIGELILTFCCFFLYI